MAESVGLYLCVFRDETDDEVEGVEVGSYEDFDRLRSTVSSRLEAGRWGSRFPTLMNHPDSDGTWSPDDARLLEAELLTIADELRGLPPEPFPAGWASGVGDQLGLAPASLFESFIDVDGEPLLDRVLDVVRASRASGEAIWFQ